jgi:hypothetical protein
LAWEFKSLKQLKGHCARCVHREIKQDRKKAPTWAASNPVRLLTKRRPKIIGRSRSGLDSRNERLWNADAQGFGGLGWGNFGPKAPGCIALRAICPRKCALASELCYTTIGLAAWPTVLEARRLATGRPVYRGIF